MIFQVDEVNNPFSSTLLVKAFWGTAVNRGSLRETAVYHRTQINSFSIKIISTSARN